MMIDCIIWNIDVCTRLGNVWSMYCYSTYSVSCPLAEVRTDGPWSIPSCLWGEYLPYVVRWFGDPFFSLGDSNERGASLTCQDAGVILPYGGYLDGRTQPVWLVLLPIRYPAMYLTVHRQDVRCPWDFRALEGREYDQYDSWGKETDVLYVSRTV